MTNRSDNQPPYYQCYYCNFSSDREDQYLRHGVMNHTYKPMFPNETELVKYKLKPQGKPWEHFDMTVEEADERLRRWAEKRTREERKQKTTISTTTVEARTSSSTRIKIARV